jgi:hypothetical protein
MEDRVGKDEEKDTTDQEFSISNGLEEENDWSI